MTVETGQGKPQTEVDIGSGKAPIQKRGSGKKKCVETQGLVLVDDCCEAKGGRSTLWKDFWVVTLIHEHGLLNDDFNKPQMQGIDLWSKIANKIASTYFDFDKDSEASSKKWGCVYDQYKADKLHNSAKRTCK